MEQTLKSEISRGGVSSICLFLILKKCIELSFFARPQEALNPGWRKGAESSGEVFILS